MLKYKEIFIKYGLCPPTGVRIPSEPEIKDNISYFKSNDPEYDAIDLRLSCVFYASFGSVNEGFMISDLTQFCKRFNVKFDLSKIHPDFLCSLNIHFTRNGHIHILDQRNREFIFDFSEEEENKYFTHFSPEYPFKKVFSANLNNEMAVTLFDYMRTTLSKIFKNADATDFLSELDAYILQEQKRLYTVNSS